MSELDVIKAIEKQINEPLILSKTDTIMNGNARCCYVINEKEQVISLNLQNCKLTNLNLLRKLKSLTKLNLSFNQLEKLLVFKELPLLTELNLQKNLIEDLSPLKSLVNLQSLNCQDNKISELKPLRELNALQQLNLQANQIKNLNPLSGLNNLKTLNLNANQLTEFNPLISLINLHVLYLNTNKITDLPGLRSLAALQEIDLRFNQLHIIDRLAELKNLHSLYANSNQIENVSGLKNLKNLTKLFLGTNKISQIDALENLSTLVELDLRFNEISDLSPLKNLTALKLLYLESNQIKSIRALKDLKNLTILNLRNNQLKHLDTLQHLTKLKQVYLSQNQIESLPDWIVELNLKIKWSIGGEGISLSGNPILSPPPDVICQGNQAVKNYFNVLIQQRKRALNEVRIFLLGDSGVGKTSFVNRLRGEAFSENELRSTRINISSWHYLDFKLHVWDCAGNSSLQASHEFFFTQNSLYMIMIDDKTQHKLKYWLKKVNHFANNAPIFVLYNKIDNVPVVFDIKKLTSEHFNLTEERVFYISCLQNKGFSEFKQGLLNQFNQLPIFKNLLLESWLQIKNALIEKQKTCHFISKEAYQLLCQQHGVEDIESQRKIVTLLQELGVCIHFKKDRVKQVYLIKPSWFIENMYAILNLPTLLKNNGKINVKELISFLNHKSTIELGNHPDAEYLIKLMLSQKMAYLKAKQFIVPQLKAQKCPENVFDEVNALRFRFYLYYLSESAIVRLCGILQQDIMAFWGEGMYLKNESLNSVALIKISFIENKLIIWVNGEKKREYFCILQQALKSVVVCA